jgi:hypothetical protein
MASLEGRDHGACRRTPSRPRALMTDPGLPTLAVLNGPLMAQAWFHDEPMTCKPSTSPPQALQALRAISPIFLSRPWAAPEDSQGVCICSPGRISPLQAPAQPGAPELVHRLLETASSFLVSCCLLHGAATDGLPSDHTAFVVAEPWFVVSEEHLADKVAPASDTGLLKHAL